MASAIVGAARRRPASTRGVDQFTWLMIRFMAVMVPLVFVINGLTKHRLEATALLLRPGASPWPDAGDAADDRLASACPKGAIAMSRKKVIVKRLNSIQNLGAMDVLCTDKTGTLTLDRVILERHCDVVRKEDDGVLLLAFLNSHFQTGLKNVLDRAVLAARGGLRDADDLADYSKVDEIPFDFQPQADVGRRRNAGAQASPDLQRGARGSLQALHARSSSRARSIRSTQSADRRPEGGIRRAVEPTASACWRSPTRTPSRARPPTRKDDEGDLVLNGLRRVSRPAERDRRAGHRSPAEARRGGQGAHRRQRTGEPQDLPRSRDSRPMRCCWARRSRR